MLRRIRSNATTAGLLLALSLLAAGAVWLAYTAACVYGLRWGLCRHPAGGWIVLLVTVAGCWLWVASHLAERLRRRLRRGMYAAVGGQRWAGPAWLRQTVRFVIDGELGPAAVQHPALLDDRSGWWVETPAGAMAWVNRQDFYEWLLEVRAQQQQLPAGRSPIAQRLWDRRIGRVQWLARCRLLAEAGVIEFTTAAPASRRLRRFDTWRIMEALEALRPVEYQ